MYYLIINREGISDSINGCPEKRAASCAKTKIYEIACSTKSDEILLLWEDKSPGSFPLWVVSDEIYLETLAYIDTYIKRFTPFTAFVRVISLSTFSKEKTITRSTSSIDTDLLIGVAVAEAHSRFDRNKERSAGLPLQAYLSTLSAAIICAINAGYDVDQLPKIVKNWEATKLLLNVEDSEFSTDDLFKLWSSILPAISNTREPKDSKSRSFLTQSAQKFLASYAKRKKITHSEWSILVNKDRKLSDAYSDFTGPREEGIENFKKLYEYLKKNDDFSSVEVDMISAAALSVLSSGSMDYFSLTLSLSESRSLMAHWYMLFTGMHEKKQIFRTAKSVGSHIRKHLMNKDTLFSRVASDISYPELKVVLSNKIEIVPFITAYSTVIDVEIYPLVRARFRIKRNSDVIHNETRGGVFLSIDEYNEVTSALSKARKALDNKYAIPKQKSLFKESD